MGADGLEGRPVISTHDRFLGLGWRLRSHSRPRTLIDLAGTVTREALEEALNDALRPTRIHPEAV